MSAIFVDSHLVHYEVIGRGKPVILLHSWFGSWRYWVPVMQSISITNRAYALDFWGFGESAKNKQYSIHQQTELLNSFFEKIGLFQCTLVGHGLGAVVARKFTNRFPDYVDKLMLIAYPFGEELINNKYFSGDSVGLMEKLIKNSTDLEPIRNDELKNDPEANKTSSHEQGNVSFSKPCLFVFGGNDLIVKTPEVDKIFNLHPESNLIVFENTGHFPMLEESSKFSRLLREFLELSDEDTLRNLQIKEKWQRRVR